MLSILVSIIDFSSSYKDSYYFSSESSTSENSI